MSRRSDLRVTLVGTGTGVGKTHVGCALIRAWTEMDRPATGLKPIESGVDPGKFDESDQARLWQASELFHVKRGAPSFHVKRSLYEFPDAVSPHLAARHSGGTIDLQAVRNWVDCHQDPIVVVETAGGLFSPLTDEATNLELVTLLDPQVVLLVAPDRLGVLHDLTATLGLARARGLLVHGVVLSAPPVPDGSTGRNAAELSRLNITAPLTVFPRAAVDHPATLAAAVPVIESIDRKLRFGLK